MVLKIYSRPERDEEAVKKRKQEKKKISAEAKARHKSYVVLFQRQKKREINFLFKSYLIYVLYPKSFISY